MSAFDYSSFYTYHGDQVVAFHAKKYTRETAFPLAMVELDTSDPDAVVCSEAWCYFGFGTDDDGDHRNTYWLTEEKRSRGFPVFAFSLKGREWP